MIFSTMLPHVYLASKSPRRRELLSQIGVSYDVISVDVPEVQGNESPEDYVQRLSQDKARAGAKEIADLPVLGADTIVVLGEQVLEKPKNKEDAICMLMALSNKTHQVMTAVSLWYQEQCHTHLNISEVTFRELTLEEAELYWETGEPVDKAGSYGIQGKGGVFVKEIRGSYSGVVGLPLYETHQLLYKIGKN